MIEYVFDRNEFEWADEYYALIKKKMNLPDWFGNNADALWDMLMGYVSTPCKIILVGFGKVENSYNNDIITLINNCFFDAAKKYPQKFQVEMFGN